MGIDTGVVGIAFAMLSELVLVIIWLVRLEGRLNYTERHQNLIKEEMAGLRVKHEALDSKIVEELTRLREALAELKGYLGASKHNN